MTTKRRIPVSEVKKLKSEILKEQGPNCPLCDVPFRQLPSRDACLDHDHGTGAIRGVLCRNCNGIEGRILKFVHRACRGQHKLNWLARLYHYHALYVTDKRGLLHHTYKTPEQKRAAVAKKAQKAYAKKKRTCMR